MPVETQPGTMKWFIDASDKCLSALEIIRWKFGEIIPSQCLAQYQVKIAGTPMLSFVQPTGESLALDDQAYLISSAKGTINFKLLSKMWRLHFSFFFFCVGRKSMPKSKTFFGK